MKVFILATCLKRERINGTLLVFPSLRVGFPTAEIHVYGNSLDTYAATLVAHAARLCGATFSNILPMPHGAWIEDLLRKESDPFWICDTDVTFSAAVEHWFEPESSSLFAGRYEPDFFEKWTQSCHVSRLHPSLMWFNPRPLRAAIRAWPGKHPFFGSVERVLIRWTFVPAPHTLYFYDTCAGLHHALGGTPFTAEQNACFHHTFAGTYAHLLGATEAEAQAHQELCAAASVKPLANLTAPH